MSCCGSGRHAAHYALQQIRYVYIDTNIRPKGASLRTPGAVLRHPRIVSASYDVIEASDGVDALEYARGNSVNLVLTDVNMPRMDGITLVRELRQLTAYKFTPMLVLTTEAGPDKKMQGKQAGATGWLVKPFNPEKLLVTIAKVL